MHQACVDLTIVFSVLQALSRMVRSFAQIHAALKITHRHDQNLSKNDIITSTNLTSVFVVVVPPSSLQCWRSTTQRIPTKKHTWVITSTLLLGGRGGGTWRKATTEVKFVDGLTAQIYMYCLLATRMEEGCQMICPNMFRMTLNSLAGFERT
jgi:hypothetical protein